MPLTDLQKQIVPLIAHNRDPQSHLAGGAAIHFEPNSLRYSEDLDFFHDTETRVADAFAADKQVLQENGFTLEVELNQIGYIRAIVSKGGQATKIEWAKDTAWRFLPVQSHPEIGFVLSPIDLAINKLLALVGRDEPRDFIDVLWTHQHSLPLAAQVWAAAGKDPGLSPDSILDLLKRRGSYRPEDFNRLNLNAPIDLAEQKKIWNLAVKQAEDFVEQAPPELLGCLFYNKQTEKFGLPGHPLASDWVPHFGSPGGVLPQFKDTD